MPESAPSLAEKLAQAMADHSVFETAQLGDILWMTSSLADVQVNPALRASWTLRIAELDAKIQMHLGMLVQACDAASAAGDTADLAVRDLDEALHRQTSLWDEIEDLETRLANDVPQILDSDWRPFPPHLKPARDARRGATTADGEEVR